MDSSRELTSSCYAIQLELLSNFSELEKQKFSTANILIVDDSNFNLEAMKSLVEHFDLDADVASNGMEAYQMFKFRFERASDSG